ncbi:MAG: hypothetical protein M3Y27_02465 [Acidobacteriota bacterium]|nr:hypothetical protein [Acidobacteriota bacterium]
MSEPLSILFGALITVITATALGSALLRALAIQLNKIEERLLGFVTGSACLSALMFLLCATHLVHMSVLLALSAASIAAAIRFGVHRPQPVALVPVPKLWKWSLGAVFAIFTVLYFVNAMAPERSPDGTGYHLPFVAAYYRAHGFVRITTNFYASLSQGVELLFLYAYSFGRHSAAALVHFAFLTALPGLMLCYARRFNITVAGAAAAIFVYASPVVGIDGTSAYVDVALAAVLFSLYYFLQIWAESANNRLLVPVGILAGFAFAIKLTAFLALLYALGFVTWILWRARKPVFQPALMVTGLALLFILPWPIKNWLWVGNPLAPFANRVFPNPYVHISFERDYLNYFRHYDLKSQWQIPYELTVGGYGLGGFLGPLFLLAPISLLGLRTRVGRQLLLAAAVLSATYFTNIGTRFLIPTLPFVSLAIAIVLMRIPALLLMLAIAHAVASWPSVAPIYCSPYAWRLESKIPFAAALRIEPEANYLTRRFPCYVMNRMIEAIVPPGETVFSLGQSCSGYTSHLFTVDFQAAPNEVLKDLLLVALDPNLQPDKPETFRFPERTARGIRITTTIASKPSRWSIAELRVYDAGKEVPREPGWRLTAKPNPWDVQLAFDNDPVTRWQTWEEGKPGMHVEVDFGRDQKLDAVVLETASYLDDPQIQLEAMDRTGRWSTVDSRPAETSQPITQSLRREATAQLKRRGLRYLLVGDDNPSSPDFWKYSSSWGLKLVGDQGGARLYYIE